MPSQLRLALRTGSRLSAMALGLLVLSCTAVGWCYLLRAPTAHWPGPKIFEALPLDETSLQSSLSHSTVSLVVFIAVVALASLLCGLWARALGFDGFAIALTVGAGVGGWLYVASAISIYIADQVTLDEAFDTTRDLTPAYVAATLFALGVALVARRRGGELWLTRIAPGAVGVFGAIQVLSATLPRSIAERHALGGMLTGPSSPVTRTVEVTVGIVLLLAARGLGRRSRRALFVAAALTVVALVARVIDGFNVVSLVVAALVLLSLVARRADFSFSGDPTIRLTWLIRAGALITGAFCYGLLALLINNTAAGLPFHVLRALEATAHALVIGAPRDASQISGDFGAWFPWSLRAIVGLGVIWGAASWFAPWRHRPVEELEHRRQAAALVEEFGADTLSPFTLRHDKVHYLYPEDRDPAEGATTLVAYRVVRGVAIVSGDPIGPPEQAAAAIAAFRAMCAARGWRFALLGASDRLLDSYRAQGLRPIYHGDEAVVDATTFSLAGGELKSVRQAVNRLSRNGYRVDIAYVGELSETERGELSALEDRWLGGGERKGFVMELDELFRLDGDNAIFVIGRGPNGEFVGFLELAVCPASSSLSLSSMTRAEEAPNGLNAALIVAAIEWAGEHDFAALSLNFSPGARLLDREQPCTGVRRVARAGLLVAKRLLDLQLDNLLMFNRHFAPRWQPRYLVIDRFRHLPRVLVAAMAAERYLPFADALRGRDWQIAPTEGDLAARSAR